MLPYLVLQEDPEIVAKVMTIVFLVVRSKFADKTILVVGKVVYGLNLT